MRSTATSTRSVLFATHEGMFGNTSLLLTKYDDVLWALKHPEVFSSKDVVDIGGEYPLIPLSVDPPDHAKYRRMLDPEFGPRKMAALEPEMRKFVNETIDTFIDRGEVDFHDEFASPLPSTFFLALTGLPHEDLPQFLKWRDDTIRPAARLPQRSSAFAPKPVPRSRSISKPRSKRSGRTPTTACSRRWCRAPSTGAR